MSRRRVQHLVSRGSGYQVRLPIPVDLQSILARKELRWSVRTREPSLAATRVLKTTLAFWQLCDKLRDMKELTVSEAQQIARAFYTRQTASYVSPPPISGDGIDYEIGYQELLADEYISARQDQIKARSFGSEVTVPAKQYAEAGGFQMPEPGSEAFRALCEGIARAQIENARFVLFRQGALLGNYQPQDELFQGASTQEPMTQHLQSSAPPIGLTLKEAVGRHVEFYSSGPSAWEPKTKEEKERTFCLVVRLWGAELPVREVNTEHVRNLRDFIQALRPRVRVDIDALDDMTAPAHGDRLNPKTASKYFGYVKTLLSWLDAEGYIDGVPGVPRQHLWHSFGVVI